MKCRRRIVCVCILLTGGAAVSEPRVSAVAADTADAEPVAERQGIIVPARRTRLVSRLDTVVKRVSVNVGDRFKRDDVLAEFDCAVERAALEEARLAHKLEKLKRDESRKQSDDKDGDEVMALRAEVALARLNHLREKAKYCKIIAPYDGRLIKVFSSPHEKVSALAPVLDVISDEGFEFHFFLPWEWRSRVPVGYRFNVTVGERNYEARLSAIALEADIVDRSFKAIAKVAGDDNLPLGISATARFDMPPP